MSGEIVYFPTNDDVMWNVVLDVTIMMMTENPKYIQYFYLTRYPMYQTHQLGITSTPR